MMKVARFYVPIIILVFIAAYGGYVLGGHKRQQKIERQFELINYSSYATDVNIDVQLIDYLEAKRYKDAEDLLEKMIDVTLDSLSLYDKLAPRYPDQKIFDAIATVKKHRETHPGHKVHETLSPGVERAFKIGKSVGRLGKTLHLAQQNSKDVGL